MGHNTFFVPSLGTFTLNLAPNCDFVKLREGYFYHILNCSHIPRIRNLTKKVQENSYAAPMPVCPLHPNTNNCIEFFYFIVTNEVHLFLCCCEPAMTQEK